MSDEASGNMNPEDQKQEIKTSGDQESLHTESSQPTPPPPSYTPPPAYGVRPPRNTDGRISRWMVPTSIAIGCLPWLILLGMLIGSVVGGGGNMEVGESVALIHVSGVITGGSSSSSVFGDASSGSEDLVDQLERARKSKKVKAVVIRINSPGGSAAGSEEVYHQIMRVRDSGKPVYASMGDVAASGGYYIAAACNKIYADQGTMTGSIGVIFQTADMSKLFDKIGYKAETVKSGKFKDIGSPNRAMTPEERALLQGMVNNIYEGFVKAVADGRKMQVEKVKSIADGRIFTGSQALEAGLVDKIGGLRDTTKAAARAAGIDGEPAIVEYGRKGFFESLFGSSEAGSRAVEEYKMMRRILQADGLK